MKGNLHSAQTREEIRQKVIGVALRAFHSEGIKNVTMDDIAHHLQMSKRTLYQLFEDKEDLLLACIREQEKADRVRMAAMLEGSDNVLDFILTEFSERMRNIENVKPAFLAEMVKFPRVMRYVSIRRKADTESAVAFFHRGVEQGYFRAEVNYYVVYALLCHQLESVFANSAFNGYSFVEIFVNTVLVIVRGCATMRGIAMIDEFMAAYQAKAH